MQFVHSGKSKVIAFIISLAMIMTCFAFTQTTNVKAAADPTFTSYSLSTYSGGKEINGAQDLDQHVVLKLTYDKAVTIKDKTALNDSIFGTDPTLTIKIAGSSIASKDENDYYYRPCTYEADGNSLLIDIGNVIDANGDPDFTAMYNGSFTAAGTVSGIELGGTSVTSDVNISETRIPIGIKLKNVNNDSGTATWDTSALTMQLTHRANVRGMYHFAVYKVVDSASSPEKVVPVTCSTGQMSSYTVTSHAHVFYDMDTTTLATSMTNALNNSLIGGYTASSDGNKITVRSDNSKDKLRMYMFDDSNLKANTFDIQTPDPKVSFAKDSKNAVSGTLNSNKGDGFVSYDLNIGGNADGLAAWVANTSKVTVDGQAYSLVVADPVSDMGYKYNYSYTRSGKTYYRYYAYLYKSSQGKYVLNVASDPMKATADISTHKIEMTNAKYGNIAQNVTVNNVTVGNASVKTLKGKKKGRIIIKLNAVSGANGYQISYSKKANMKAAKIKTVTKTSKTITRLKKGKRYYVKVRAYKYDSTGQKVFGSWSKVKSVKTK